MRVSSVTVFFTIIAAASCLTWLGFVVGEQTSAPACNDTVKHISVSKTCPEGSFLELVTTDDFEHYVICHCPQSIKSFNDKQLENDGDDKKPPAKPRAPISVEL